MRGARLMVLVAWTAGLGCSSDLAAVVVDGSVPADLGGAAKDGSTPPDLSAAIDFAVGAPDLSGAGDLASTVPDLARVPDLAHGSGDGGSTHAIKTVFIIVMENSNWSTIKGSTHAPYINNVLLPAAAHAEAYGNLPGLHPSEPNYLWLEAGTNFGITADGQPAADHQSSTSHLVNQLEAAGLGWKSYQEDIDGTTCPLTSVKEYVPRHNPVVYFDDVTNTNDTTAARCIAHVRPYSELATELANKTVAPFNFITPNLCHDMHGDLLNFTTKNCNTLNILLGTDLVKAGDDWLAAEIPKIQASEAYQNGGVLFVTWDESEGGDLPIGMIVASPLAKINYSNTIAYNHSSTLRTLQEIFAIGPALGGAAGANDLADLFTTFP